MFYMMLLLILLIGITFTLLGLPDQSGKQTPTSAHPVLSEGSSALLWAVQLKEERTFQISLAVV